MALALSELSLTNSNSVSKAKVDFQCMKFRGKSQSLVPLYSPLFPFLLSFQLKLHVSYIIWKHMVFSKARVLEVFSRKLETDSWARGRRKCINLISFAVRKNTFSFLPDWKVFGSFHRNFHHFIGQKQASYYCLLNLTQAPTIVKSRRMKH